MVKPSTALIPGKLRKAKPLKAFISGSLKKIPPYSPRFSGKPTTDSVTLKSLAPKAGTQIYLLGDPKPLLWSQQGANIRVALPRNLPGQYAYVLEIAGPVALASSSPAALELRQ